MNYHTYELDQVRDSRLLVGNTVFDLVGDGRVSGNVRRGRNS